VVEIGSDHALDEWIPAMHPFAALHVESAGRADLAPYVRRRTR